MPDQDQTPVEQPSAAQDNPPAETAPRIGVYTCYCGGNISKVVQCEKVAKALGRMPHVAVSRTNMSLCSDAGQSMIEQDIRELGINRVVIGACAPSLHEQTFRGTVIRAGLNPYLYQHMGLREQDSWVHHADPEGATEKAIRMMSAGVAKARLLQPLQNIRLEARKHALVIGGGVAGLRAALEIARQGLKVTLVEKAPVLGGRMAQLDTLFPTDEPALPLLQDLISDVSNHPNIDILVYAEVKGISGYVGNFQVAVQQHARGVNALDGEEYLAACDQEVPDEFNYGLTQRKVIYRPFPGCYPETPVVDWQQYDGSPIQVDGKRVVLRDRVRTIELNVGAIVLATGFDPYQPRAGEYGYDEIPEVVTLPQLIRYMALHKDEKQLTWNGRPVRDVVLIQCVGSRQKEGVSEPQPDGRVNDYCSRVCCTANLHMANELHQRYPEINLFNLYQDIRTYGRGQEDYYRQAMKNQVRFIQYHGDELPEVLAAPADASHPVVVRVKDYLTYGEELDVPADLVVLAVGMMPRQIDDLVQMLKVSRGVDRFLLEVHPKLRPVETAINGVVLAGTAQGPMNIQEAVTAASAAAAKVSALLRRGYVELPPYVAAVDPAKCEGHGACVQVCEYDGAIALQTLVENGKEIRRAVVTPANCSGCGACVSACPTGAIDIQGWTLAQYDAMVEAIAMDDFASMEVS
ncbi:MAG: CoB--CoM heterodisulfide reductase iron-sulfur subunit A family protein [Anaerolineae bacterium]|nr:CoB--CoM heterodisulfide reductase iron-sulfur subunit A family protein [Anaerolineae bacterium]MCZ7553146.1 CoB--CoM heterodisulfide reductase iron-sulfur subunit A family protein [Anaerolineales bacterium]